MSKKRKKGPSKVLFLVSSTQLLLIPLSELLLIRLWHPIRVCWSCSRGFLGPFALAFPFGNFSIVGTFCPELSNLLLVVYLERGVQNPLGRREEYSYKEKSLIGFIGTSLG